MKRQPSLKWRLIVQPLIFHLLALILAFFVLLWILVRADRGGGYTIEAIAKTAAASIVRTPDGKLAVTMTPELAEIVERAPHTWFVAEDSRGTQVTFGEIPRQYASLMGHLNDVSFGDIRGRPDSERLAVVIRHETGPAGDLTVLAHGEVTELTLRLVMAANVLIIPIFALLALVTLILVPLIVRRTLSGVARIADEADGIDINQRGIRLTETEVPREIGPLVKAVNAALSRLDDGYERQRRFIASAAHELRTPIAILRLKVEAAGDATSRQLSGEVARLSTLAEQLLDLHRLDSDGALETADLAALARRVAADLAPLLIATGKSVEVVVDRCDPVRINTGAIERSLSNLIQNAAEHGGKNIVVRAYDTCLEVEDDGPGIPPEDRERMFEPFQRIRPRQTGVGLGLNLVQQVVERHGGRVTILDAPDGGALIRIDLPST
jgi:two-component system, OmpR family, sensor histidine kinase TctE